VRHFIDKGAGVTRGPRALDDAQSSVRTTNHDQSFCSSGSASRPASIPKRNAENVSDTTRAAPSARHVDHSTHLVSIHRD
jgi:hypothetical protein